MVGYKFFIYVGLNFINGFDDIQEEDQEDDDTSNS